MQQKQLYGAIDFVYKPVNAFRLKHAFNLAMNKSLRSRKYAIQDMMVEMNKIFTQRRKNFMKASDVLVTVVVVEVVEEEA